MSIKLEDIKQFDHDVLKNNLVYDIRGWLYWDEKKFDQCDRFLDWTKRENKYETISSFRAKVVEYNQQVSTFYGKSESLKLKYVNNQIDLKLYRDKKDKLDKDKEKIINEAGQFYNQAYVILTNLIYDYVLTI